MMMPMNIKPLTVRRRALQTIFITALLMSASFAWAESVRTGAGDTRAISVAVDIPLDELEMQIKHLKVDQLKKEADQWQSVLMETVYDLNQAKIEVKRENELLEAAKSDETSPNDIIEKETQEKEETLGKVGELRERRVQIIDRMKVVLDELSAKLGEADDGKEHDDVVQYRLYIDAVEGVQVDISDTQSTRVTVVSWLKSTEGGLRLARRVAVFLGTVLGFWLLGLLLSRVAGKALLLSRSASQILKKFVIDSIRRVAILAGFLVGLAAVGTDITPLVAIIGAAGFVIAFALQNTLSNFASGLLIMLYKPFDIGDFVETSAVSGRVKSMTLVTTNMMTPDNKLLVVPNNELWGKVITNVTGSSERRVDMVFGIGYNDDIALAERALSEVVTAHPLVLKEPEPIIRVSELADSSVNLICRPWVNTPDYWTVYWELTRAVKERFDAEGISIPFPQRDVHVRGAYQLASPSASEGPAKASEMNESS